MSEKTGTFVVTNADEESAVLRDVTDAQVHTLSAHPDLSVGEVLDATIRPEPPMEVTWELLSVSERREIPIERSPERPTKQAREIAAAQDVGEVTTRERAGEGELHVLTVPGERTEEAVVDVREDDATLRRAARLGVDRVEIRADDGVLSVRYLP
ncbi:DUF5812 family protein [Halorhabdus amylolytica]|uniref:DUF5812 family protein n=1 Tax=Halorhabdus amylolytica TaxID=2559573 RepID=UPI0010A9D3A9|nr:DUF5812 family protein [Halorhabdus amylolytica]